MKHGQEQSLGGKWRFRPDPEGMGEHYPQQLDIPWQYDARWMSRLHGDGEWAEIAVPACWQAEGYVNSGLAWYRRRFTDPLPGSGKNRLWLRFEGVDYFSDLWLNEHYLCSHEGYFGAFQTEVTRYLQDENLLCLRVDSPNDIRAKENQIGQLKTLVKGALQRWDANNPEVNPGGIWNDVKLILTGPGAITALSVRTSIPSLPDPSATGDGVPAMALVSVSLAGFVDPPAGADARLRVRIAQVGFEGEGAEAVVPVVMASQACVWQVPVHLEQARLWYTWDLGEPCLYRVKVTLEVGGRVSDEVQQTLGFRTLERRKGWETYLNGIRIFQRGANYLSDQLLSSMTPARYETDVRLLREANLNTVHPFCVVERQEFYDLCDRCGILVYQDFPMWLMMSNGSDLVRRATAQMRELIEQYGHHPSIAVWNCGSQASVANFEKLCSALAHEARTLDPTRLVQESNALVDLGTPHEVPADPLGTFHWTEKVVADFQERFDWRVDTHQYRGWYSKDLRALDEVPDAHLELVTEYGAEALPSRPMLEQIIPAGSLFPPKWPAYTRRCFQPEYQFIYIPLPDSLDDFVNRSQAYQAEFLQYHTEHYRRHKFSPCNGAHMFVFNDCWPAITWSVVDYLRERKAGFFALQRAMAPIQVMLEPCHTLRAGAAATHALWLVNDFPRPFAGLELRWTVQSEREGDRVASSALQCRAEANSLDRIGALTWTPGERGRFSLQLNLYQDGRTIAENLYRLIASEGPDLSSTEGSRG